MDNLLDPNIVNEEEIIIKAEQLLAESNGNLAMRNEAIDQVVNLLLDLPDEGSQDLFIDELSKKFKIKKSIFRSKLKSAARRSASGGEDLPVEIDIPEGVDKEDAMKKGFFEAKGAYYFLTKDGLYRASNFVVKPVLHIYSKVDNKRIIEVRNEYGEQKTLDLPSKNLVSTDLFQQSVFNEGNFIFFGTKIHHYRILSSIARDFPVANELRTLGWQREGFFAFSNGIFNGAWHPVDDIGVTEHNSVKYFSPAFSKIYSEVREDDDDYENDRFFIYQKSPVTLAQWSQLMLDVYGERARIAISFLIASIFRNFIYEIYKIFPHLFLFGEKQSGKSQLAWSLSNVFFNQMPAFNLNSGTQVGFFRRLSRVKNVICWFDEYTNDIDERRFQALKSAYDGMGHEKGKMTKDSRTEITKVNSACVISGQYLPTRDDNSLLTRSVLILFEKSQYSSIQIEKFNRLKELETKGISSLVTEILMHRAIIEKNFIRTFSEEFDRIKNHMQDNKLSFDERLVRNFACLLSPVKITLENHLLDLGFSYQDLFHMSIEMIADQTAQITSSEAVSTFWMMIQFMYESKPSMISDGEDFKIQTTDRTIRLKNKREQWETIDFSSEPKKLIFFRFSKIHPLYMEAHRKQYGKNGVDMVSMTHYIKHHKAYLGYTDSTRFDSMVTSAYVFDYRKLGINLERMGAEGASVEGSFSPVENNVPF